MKHLLLLIAALFLLKNTVSAQENATDFTANDCSGISHTLSAELSQGKVVVLAWVMPCANCINDAKGAYDAVQSFNSSNPGKVVYYMIDDNGGTSCNTLVSWANTNAIKENVTFFRNQGSVINEDMYGGTGMPHVVVVGPDMKIYFNVINGKNNRVAIQDAISKALTVTSVAENVQQPENISVYPSPAKESITVSFSSELLQQQPMYEIYNTLGQRVLVQNTAADFTSGQLQINVSQLVNGVYFLKVAAGKQIFVKRFLVSK